MSIEDEPQTVDGHQIADSNWLNESTVVLKGPGVMLHILPMVQSDLDFIRDVQAFIEGRIALALQEVSFHS
jgi:hypothetical protein